MEFLFGFSFCFFKFLFHGKDDVHDFIHWFLVLLHNGWPARKTDYHYRYPCQVLVYISEKIITSSIPIFLPEKKLTEKRFYGILTQKWVKTIRTCSNNYARNLNITISCDQMDIYGGLEVLFIFACFCCFLIFVFVFIFAFVFVFVFLLFFSFYF